MADFVAAIEAERACLTQGEPNALPALTERKSALATRLADAEIRRETALGTAGFGRGRSGVDAWLATNPARRDGPRQAWARILELAAKAKLENEINGQLITARLQQNQQALNTLLGDSNSAGTYGANGQTSTAAGRRTLGSA